MGPSSYTAPILHGLLLLTAVGRLLANPQGEQVRSGAATFERNGASLRILQASDRAIIHWQDFSIGAGEVTEFLQPSPNSATLNRVVGALPSSIHGQLRANGKVFLINPNGVLVGPTGRIDAQSFIASALDVPDAAFLSGGDLNFTGPSQAAVVNQGVINAIGGDIFLLGRTVENHGALNAPQGTVGLGAGQEILLKQAGEERLLVKPAGSGKSEKGVVNTGTIQAATAELKSHGNLYAMAINNSGTIRANAAVNRSGRVLLVSSGGSRVVNSGQISAKKGKSGGEIRIDAGAGGMVENSGKLDAASVTGNPAANPNASGGRITVEGSQLTFSNTAEVNAGGLQNGGEIRLGGGFQGRDPSVRNAETINIAPQVRITADGAVGNGGRVVVWSNGSTTFNGNISARSLGSGQGGVAEVSGRSQLDFQGTADMRSARGAAGTLLLDPSNVEVNTVSTVAGASLVTPGAITSQLNLGHVVVHTSGADGEEGDIFINAPVLYGSLNNLTFAAHDDILVRSTVINDGVAGQGGGITLISGWDGVTGFSGTPDVPLQAGNFAILGVPASYGNGVAEISIGAAIATKSSAVGSRYGDTNLFGGYLTLRGTDSVSALPFEGYAQVGIPLRLTPGAPAGGNIRVQMHNDIQMTGGSRAGAYAQIGHGASFSAAPAVSQALTGVITVGTEGNVSVLGGTTSSAYSQIGHGGANVRADFSGPIVVRAADTLVNAKSGFAQIGHGGLLSIGPKQGTINTINTGSLTVRGDSAFAQVGHGGSGGSGFMSGSIIATSVGLELLGGNGTGAMALLGHGGSNFASGASGDVTVISGGQTFLSGGQGRGAAAQIGHGGYWSIVPAVGPLTLSGMISVDSGGPLDLSTGVGQPESYAQIGHGGVRAPGAKSGDISIVTGNSGEVFASAKTSQNSYVQIGHGGSLSNGAVGGAIQILVSNAALTLTNDTAATTAQIGHSALSTPAGSYGGAILVHAESVNVDGGLASSGGSLIGHRGNFNKFGNLTVEGGQVFLTADGPDAFSQIGHRNEDGGGTAASGNIQVNSQSVLMAEPATPYAVQIGHFAPDGNASLTGDIQLDSFSIDQESGSLVGHRGGAFASGNLTANGESLTMFGASRVGHMNAFGERHGDLAVTVNSALIEGAIGHAFAAGEVTGNVTVKAATTLELSGSIGHAPAAVPDFSPAAASKTWISAGELILNPTAALHGGVDGEVRIYIPLLENLQFTDATGASFNDRTEAVVPVGQRFFGYTFGTGPYAAPYSVYYTHIARPIAVARKAYQQPALLNSSQPVLFRPVLREFRAADSIAPEDSSDGTSGEAWDGGRKKKRGSSSYELFQQEPVVPQPQK